MRVAVVGTGAIGRAVMRLVLDHRRGLELVAVASADETVVGAPVVEIAEARGSSDLIVGSQIASVLAVRPEIVFLATGSFLEGAEAQVLDCVAASAHVISPCEELAYPMRAHDRDAGARIDQAARSAGVSVLGTGVNPGFMFDSILTAAAGVCWDVRSVWGRRVVDVVGFSRDIHRRLGIGYTVEEFEDGHGNGTIAGHVGFPESIGLVCERLRLQLDRPVEERFEPMIAETPATTVYGEVPVGHTEGFSQIATGRVSGQEWIRLELLLHLRPAAAGVEPADLIRIDGEHPVNLEFRPGMDAIKATSAQLVNSVPTVLAAEPGLHTVTDLPDPAPWFNESPREIPGILVERRF